MEAGILMPLSSSSSVISPLLMDLIHKNYGFGKDGGELLDIANEMMRDFYANTVETKVGVKEFLERCRSKGIRMCIASATAKDEVRVAVRAMASLLAR